MTSISRQLRAETKRIQEEARKRRHAKRNSPEVKRERLLSRAVDVYVRAEERRLRMEGQQFTQAGYEQARKFAREQAEKVISAQETALLTVAAGAMIEGAS